ncbi:MAG TPA: hypothetical protein VN848_10380 [Gemmatimonadales bacterium]|nr:hypothetical protein [Gemmatimonadales bacterium]
MATACPGVGIQADYGAVLGDSTHVPFERRYDKDHPPRLHVIFLDLSSDQAAANSDANWTLAPDPLVSAVSGFRLDAALRAKPSVHGFATVAPDYSCMPHTFEFAGHDGGGAQAGLNGPDVTVRLGLGRSSFYGKLIVASVAVGSSSPFYLLYDATAVPPANWLTIGSRGGRGGRGSEGPAGGSGSSGAPGCPAQAGGSGGDGGGGGPGAPGGRGGTITIIVPANQPYLAGLVDSRSPGGRGGPGGPGGPGGNGGRGGQGSLSPTGGHCPDAVDGPSGRQGPTGPDSYEGPRGPRPAIVTANAQDVFGTTVPPVVQMLLSQAPN